MGTAGEPSTSPNRFASRSAGTRVLVPDSAAVSAYTAESLKNWYSHGDLPAHRQSFFRGMQKMRFISEVFAK